MPVAVQTAPEVDQRAASTGVAAFLSWSVLVLISQACSLALIDQGTRLHYQHYLPFGEMLTLHPLPLAVLIFQALAVAAGLRVRRGVIAGWSRKNLRVWQLAILAALFLLTPATLSRQPARYVEELLFAAMFQTVQLGNALLILTAVPPGLASRVSEIAKSWTAERNTFRVILIAAAWTTVLSGALAFFVYERHPHLQDEVAYYLHAKMLSKGIIQAPALPVPEAFAIYLAESTRSGFYLATMPGWPAVLALAMLAGVPWLVNPLLAGISVVLLFLLIRETCGTSTGLATAILFSLAPWQIFLAMSFMTHTLTLALALASLLLLLRARRNVRLLLVVAAGILSGLAVVVRPLDGVMIGILLGLMALAGGTLGARLQRLLTLGAGAALPFSAMFLYNWSITGAPLVFPLNDYIDRHFGKGVNDFGFGADKGFGWALDPFPGHSPLDAIVNANLNISTINFDLLGWGIGSMLVVGLIVLSARQRLGRPEWGALGVIIAVVGTHSFYYFSGGPDFGGRYWFLIMPALLLLAVRGMQAILERVQTSGPVIAAAAVLCISANLTVVPWRAWEKYFGYLGMRPEARNLVEQNGIGRALILVRGAVFPDYASAAVYSSIGLSEERPVFAYESSADVAQRLVLAFADRPLWILEGASLHPGGARLLGPFPPGRLPR
jgi:hypothetical protein